MGVQFVRCCINRKGCNSRVDDIIDYVLSASNRPQKQYGKIQSLEVEIINNDSNNNE